ncbi:MAG: iron ABC transporter substrate-binding protein [Candidatus Nanopelagicales bacterium]
MKSIKKLLIAGGATALAVVGLSACSSSSSSSENSLTVYSGRSESLVKPLYDKFTEQTGIALNVRYGDSAELSAQIAEEGSNTPAQVFYSQDAGAIGALEKASLLAPLPTSVATTVPQVYRTANWTGISARARSIVYNPTLVPKAPKTVFDLVKPEYKGQLGIAPNNASFQSFVTAMRMTEGNAKTEAWLKGIVANGVQKFENNVTIVNAINDGKLGIGLVNHYYWFEIAKEKGGAQNMKATQAFTSPGDPGSLVNVSAAGLTATNANNANAEKLIAFLLSVDSQTYFATETFEYPLLPGIPGPDGAPPLSSLQSPPVKLNDLSDLPGTQAMLRSVGLI